MNILEKIIVDKKNEVERCKLKNPIGTFTKDNPFWTSKNRSLAQSLLASGSNGIIAEFKRKSPSKGWFKPKDFGVAPVVTAYGERAAGISVLTDMEFFGGKMQDLVQAQTLTQIPILRKDFIIDKWQIAESKAFGADVILLIAACLTVVEVKEFALYANDIGLETILEVHNEKELEKYCEEVSLVGINNRDLATFEVNINTSLRLIEKLPYEKPAIAESGINSVESITLLKNAGFKGFLIGENFMKEEQPEIAFKTFISQLKK